ncbi:hypothetical protein GF420_04110 [candidate division GN15 bacterium]|nr:hypothetical protein [candidate division GN15 bacterium]
MLTDFWPIILRVVSVLAGCAAGLMIGGLIYFVFFEDTVVSSGSRASIRSGKVLMVGAVLFFLISVYILHLNIISPIVVSLVAMAVTRLLWALGEGLQDAGRVYEVLANLKQTDRPVRKYLEHAHTYRQVQDLRRAAREMYVPGSPQLRTLEKAIDEVVADEVAGDEQQS